MAALLLPAHPQGLPRELHQGAQSGLEAGGEASQLPGEVTRPLGSLMWLGPMMGPEFLLTSSPGWGRSGAARLCVMVGSQAGPGEAVSLLLPG